MANPLFSLGSWHFILLGLEVGQGSKWPEWGSGYVFK